MATKIKTVPYELFLRFDPDGQPVAMHVALADVRWVDGVADLDASRVRAPTSIELSEGLPQLQQFSAGMVATLGEQVQAITRERDDALLQMTEKDALVTARDQALQAAEARIAERLEIERQDKARINSMTSTLASRDQHIAALEKLLAATVAPVAESEVAAGESV